MRPRSWCQAPWPVYFNPRTPVGCDRNEWCRHSPQPHFNPRTPVGCDFPYTAALGNVYEFQSTHPSGVRLAGGIGQTGQRRISIHAPQWGATPPACWWSASMNHFNPRTPVGCDGTKNTPLGIRSDFNPRTPVGCDLHAEDRGKVQLRISIHAPQWGATWLQILCASWVLSFQSTHPSGVRQRLARAEPAAREFQSTHPSGVRRTGRLRHPRRLSISIHAPQWGATAARVRECHGLGISIHAPQWGATIRGLSGSRSRRDFNPRTPVGCDKPRPPTNPTPAPFQSTHPSGVRLSPHSSWPMRPAISIHAPQWGATVIPEVG